MASPIEVHYWPTPNGHKVTIALEEMGLPYEIVPVNIGRGDQFKPEFLAISPNNRMPAIVDPDGPGGQPISIFESGAILQYLGRKTGQFYGGSGDEGERRRVAVEEWLMWQMANLGPNSGQANHFRNYAPMMTSDQRHIAYGAVRYSNEVHRLYGVMETRLEGHEYLAGEYSIADMATAPWVSAWKALGIHFDDFPKTKAWHEKILAREPVKRALAKGEELRRGPGLNASGKDAEEARKVLFGQRAR
ncbi:glutathione S-transferase N-terminal domain-containing protein [Phenylobacterium sp. J426]|uniref:glutathione S-transferase N-terminal domain-containing protein n=1 Tax=Phenylobacterium sp. J426 TaxID=2898439 RepID=UPI0021519D0B|nr:glutathione S-transferase N-terminal domain-containing protein [Phenylobacterium sp. J426]MCR5875460.1 glutathione S-transferase N-terminal domain-containing protein [Phenylobacterium sp. J426]